MKTNNVSILVLAYPKFKDKDYRWIQSIREKYDKIFYNVVEPHFTIVFPVFNYDLKLIKDHAAKVSSNIKSIKFSVRTTTIVKDSFSEGTDIFLVPDEGNSDLIKLHGKFYTGILFKELRLDIPFIPHIAIGRGENALESKKLSDKINEEEFLIEGIIEELDLVEYEHPRVETISKYHLI